MFGKKLTTNLSVAPQLSSEDVEQVAASGFHSIVCNRPDGEKADQPSSDEIRQKATSLGLEYRYMPVISGNITEENIQDFQKALQDMPKPILAHCASGTRSTNLWALAEAVHTDPDQLISTAAEAGYDLSGLKPRLVETNNEATS